VCRRPNCVILCLKSSPPCVTSVLLVHFERSGGYAMRFPAWTDGAHAHSAFTQQYHPLIKCMTKRNFQFRRLRPILRVHWVGRTRGRLDIE
jgi:hypothetical protein